MILTKVRIQNFKGLKDVDVPLSRFGCLIGENNSGKSSVLQALLVLLPGSAKKPTESDFFDKSLPIRIELQIDEINDEDLARISNDEHRASFAADVSGESVRLVRIVEPGASGKSQLLISRLGPKNEAWTPGVLDPAMKGKLGEELRATVVGLIPELDALLPAKPTQVTIKALRDQLVGTLSRDELVYRDEPIGTGIDAGIKNFLPEPIYIEAVKDVSEQVKTTDSATFGKLLGLLLEEVQSQFGDVEDQFKEIQRKLSRVFDDSGTLVDDRIDEVKAVEGLINKFVQESFQDVDLRISVPVPKMKTILSSAEISANDGHDGPITSKGDGLKRAIAFAILRAYTNFRSSGISNNRSTQSKYWLLFEEPELYLHPRAQKQLFSALEAFAQEHPVLVTTHSPLFFAANSTQSFTKFEKFRPNDGATPFTKIQPVLIDDPASKTSFQIICHENNSIGFFARQVVLVEGESDLVLFPHIAKLLDPSWDAVEQNISFARTNGKGSIQNYRSFFAKFAIPVHVICDLDALLGGFDKLEADEGTKEARATLLQLVDKQLAPDSQEITGRQAKDLASSGEARALWRKVKEAQSSLDGTEETCRGLSVAMENFFAFTKKSDRLIKLKEPTGEIEKTKLEVLDLLRSKRTHVLALGAIEDYYASNSPSKDKLKQAIAYRTNCETLDQYRRDLGARAEIVEAELRTIMEAIFNVDSSLTESLET